MSFGNKDFLIVVIVVLVCYIVLQDRLIQDYEQLSDQLLGTVDKLLRALIKGGIG